jgi:outer membrane receptor protein involved in Fe transport
MDYDNIQVSIFTNIAPVIKNGGEGEVNGFELEAFLPLPTSSSVEASFSYLDAKYTAIDPGATEINLEFEICYDARNPSIS